MNSVAAIAVDGTFGPVKIESERSWPSLQAPAMMELGLKMAKKKEKKRLLRIPVGRERRDGSGIDVVQTFYTHYRARKFVQEQIAHQEQRDDSRWVIGTAEANSVN